MPKAIGKLRSEKFQEILDEFSPKVTGDNKSEVLSGLKQLKGVFTDTIDSLVLASGDAEDKRKANLKLEKDNLKLTDDNKTLTESAESSETDITKELKTVKDENVVLKENAGKYDKHNKSEFIKKLTIAIKHPKWEDIKEKFSSLELDKALDKEGKIDPEKITKEMIENNEIRLTDLMDAGLFGKVSKPDVPSKNTINDDDPGGKTIIKSREALTDKIEEGFKGLES